MLMSKVRYDFAFYYLAPPPGRCRTRVGASASLTASTLPGSFSCPPPNLPGLGAPCKRHWFGSSPCATHHSLSDGGRSHHRHFGCGRWLRPVDPGFLCWTSPYCGSSHESLSSVALFPCSMHVGSWSKLLCSFPA